MNRGGAVEAKTPLKDGGNAGELGGRATKSGRKVKRPAHFDDSPDAKKSAASAAAVEEVSPKRKAEVPEAVKKSARKTIFKPQVEESSPKRNGEPAVEVTKKSARKTLAKQDTYEEEPEPVQKPSRKTMTAAVTKEDSPEPEAAKKSARKTLLKSAGKKTSEQSPVDTPKKGKQEVESPKKSATKKAEVIEEEIPAGPGISRTGRKIKIPAHLKEFEDVVVPTPKKEAAEKPAAAARKSLAPTPAKKEEVVATTKTPGRARSMAPARKEPEPESEPEEPKPEPKAPRRGKSLAPAFEKDADPLALPASPKEVKSPRKAAKSPVKAPKPDADPLEVPEAKTPRRRKSVAALPEATKSPQVKEADKPPAKTPSRRGKSMAAAPAPSSPPEKASKTPKPALSAAKPVEDSTASEPMSRSGRKIKPKKYFGEFEEDESAAPAPTPVPTKAASPVKSSPVATKKQLPPQVKVASPVKTAIRSSPVAARKESPKAAASPVKRHQQQPDAALMQLPKKRAKLEPAKLLSPDEPLKTLEEISPNTEERQITKRGVNDHHHAAAAATKADAVVVEAEKETPQPPSSNDKEKASPKAQKQPVEEDKPKRGRKTLAEASKPEQSPVVEESNPNDQPQPDKPKRGRKTLPAPASSDEGEEPAAPKAPKTPVARRMTTAVVAPAVADDTGSSRSGRKIKPKKFFGEDEPVSASKPKAAAPVNGAGTTGGRGRRKTLAAELDKAGDSDAKEDKVEQVVTVVAAPQAEVEKCPSREEIMAVVGVVDPVVDHSKQKKMKEEQEAVQTEQKEEEEEKQETKQHDDDEPTPMEEDQPQESEPEPITTPVVGTEPEEPVVEDDEPQAADEQESVADSEPMSTDNVALPTTVAESAHADLIESVDPEDVTEESVSAVAQEEEEESNLAETETVESTQEDFQVISIPQTSPRPSQTTMPEEVPESPAQLHEEPPAVAERSDPEPTEPVTAEVEQAPEVSEVTEEPDHVPEQEQEEVPESSEAPVEEVPEEESKDETEPEQVVPVPEAEAHQQPAEVSASSSFSEALVVEDETERPGTGLAEINDSKDQQYESVEFLEMSGASTAANEQATIEATNGHQQKDQVEHRISTPDLEDDLDDTEAPPMDDIDAEKEDELLEDVPEPTDVTFSERDRDNESIIVIPDTPKPPKSEFDAEFDLNEKSPVPQSSQTTTVGRVELHHSPVMKQEMVPATPRTPDSKPIKTSCSPDKPDDQEQADVPHEIIDITDSPIAMLDPKVEQTDGKPGSTTSTPLRMGSKMTAKDRLIQNSRKRSLSASDAEIAKKNVTFHSPANSTILVDTIDERLKKKNESASKIPSGHRKRSMSEHKDTHQDGPKPSKISKLPNFKNIHQQQFNRMESIEEFHNRKVQRAKDILATSTVKSPAATALVRSAERPPLQKSSSLQPKSPHKTGNGASSSSSSSVYHHSKPAVARPLIPKPSAESHPHPHKPLSDAERQEKRQHQFQTTFKSKSQAGGAAGGSGSKDTPDGTRRVIEQSRHKQSQILKGVRTNKRFELLMKYRDAQE